MSESKRQYEYFCKYLDEAMTETGRGWMTISPIAICPKWLWSWPCAVTPARWPRRQVLAILAQRTGHEELLSKKKVTLAHSQPNQRQMEVSPMHDYIIMTDSSCDLPDTMVRELDLQVLPLAFTIDGQTYLNYPDNREMSPEELCRIREVRLHGHHQRGQRRSGHRVHGMFSKKKEGHFSAGLFLRPVHNLQFLPNCRQRPGAAISQIQTVCVVDTLCASLGQGLIVYLAAQMKQGRQVPE